MAWLRFWNLRYDLDCDSSSVLLASGNPLHRAAKVGCCDDGAIEKILERRPGYAEELNKDGYTPLHIACMEGHWAMVKSLVQNRKKLCLLKDKYGATPLHTAAMGGRLDLVKLLMDACPESVKEVTATGKTCLHFAVMYNKAKVIQHLVKWLRDQDDGDYTSLIDRKDRRGNTVLHIATSRKQLQTLRVLLSDNPYNTRKLLDVNAMNSGGFTALDILDVIPYCGKIDMEIDKILRRAGALRARDITNNYNNQSGVHDHSGRKSYKPSHFGTSLPIIRAKNFANQAVLLITATLLATITYQAAFSTRGTGALREAYEHNYDISTAFQMKKRDLMITRSFILFNSTGFVASVAIIIYILHEYPLKPWPQITVSMLFGSYMCTIMAVSPAEAWVLLFIAIPFLLLAAAGKLYGLREERSCVSSGYGDRCIETKHSNDV